MLGIVHHFAQLSMDPGLRRGDGLEVICRCLSPPIPSQVHLRSLTRLSRTMTARQILVSGVARRDPGPRPFEPEDT
jgi:hypothetical protein